MTINATAPSVHGLPGLDDPVVAYTEWRTECRGVWTAYREWTNAHKADGALAYAAYAAALDREDAAASAYSRLVLLTFREADSLVGLDPAGSSLPTDLS
jgi:hypothetical protein